MTVTQTPTKQDVMRDLEHNTSKEGLEIDDVLLDYIADILLEESMHTGAVTCAADLSSVIGELVAEEEADALNNAIYEGLTASFWATLPQTAEPDTDTDVTIATSQPTAPERASAPEFECLPQPLEMGRTKRETRHSGVGYVVESIEDGEGDSSDESDDDDDDDNNDDEEGEEEGPIEGCVMCERPMPITKHHLIPRKVHKYYKKKGYTSAQLQLCIMVCRDCHSAVHRIYNEKTLASSYYTLELLMDSAEIQKFVAYAAKQKLKSRGDPRLNASKKRCHLNKD